MQRTWEEKKNPDNSNFLWNRISSTHVYLRWQEPKVKVCIWSSICAVLSQDPQPR